MAYLITKYYYNSDLDKTKKTMIIKKTSDLANFT